MAPRPAEQRVREWHQRGVDATNRGRPAVGARAFRTGLRLLGWPGSTGGHPELVVRLLGSLAAAQAALGNSESGIALLDSAEPLVTPAGRGILDQQRGLLLVLVGRMDEALACLDRAVPRLRRAGEHTVLARTLLNRAMLHQTAGRVTRALADLRHSERLGREQNLPSLVAKAIHGRGSCELLAGNIPAALRAFETARRMYTEHADGMLAVVAVERARALLAAGLHRDAAGELDFALDHFPRIRMDQEHAEAQLTRAQVALAAGDPAAARTWARRAEVRFRRRGNETWAAVAAAGRLRAALAAGRRRGVAPRAAELAGRLRDLGLDNDAEATELLAARALVAKGKPARAQQHIRPRSGPRSLLETRLLRRLVQAELGTATGDRAAVFRHARAGLALLTGHQARIGSVDLRTGTTSLGRELAATGLAAALATGSPAVAFGWLERCRAQAFRFQPVRPPAEVDAVAELRQLAHQVRAAELAGQPDQEARRRCVQLQREIRARDWHAEGVGEGRAVATFAELKAGLSAAGAVLVSYTAVAGRLHALVVDGGRGKLFQLGEPASVAESLHRLHSDLDALCGRRLPAALDEVIRASVRRQLGSLADRLVTPLRPLLGDSDVVVVPTGALSTVPWGTLPELRGRPVTVTPSASTWLAGRGAPPVAGRRLLVAGPDLEHAENEIRQLGKIYDDSTVLSGRAATVQSALRELDGCATAHFAAHGHHEWENVLFSRLDLADGPLMAYDIHQLGTAPAHVVLSSCDVGQTLVRTGDEILGFTAALLYSGTRTVVSSVAKVDDRAAVDVMSAYHQGVLDGSPPARALADATATQPLMPFVCFGSS